MKEALQLLQPGRTLNAVDSDGNYTYTELEGRTFAVEDFSSSGVGVKGRRTGSGGKIKRYAIVRNVSGITLAAKRLVTLQASATHPFRVDGYARTNETADAYPVDDALPSSGVPNGYLFLIGVEGPHLCTTAVDNGNADISLNDWLMAVTAAASTGTTAGRIWAADDTTHGLLNGDSSSTDTDIFHLAKHAVGRAMSANVTNSTAADILVDVSRRRF